jgi:hypothetical protein
MHTDACKYRTCNRTPKLGIASRPSLVLICTFPIGQTLLLLSAAVMLVKEDGPSEQSAGRYFS